MRHYLKTRGLESGVERLTGSECVQQLGGQGPNLSLSAPSVAGYYSDHDKVSYITV